MSLRRALSFSAVVTALLLGAAVSPAPLQAQTFQPIATGHSVPFEVAGPFSRQVTVPADALADQDKPQAPSGIALPLGLSVDGLSYIDYAAETGSAQPLRSVSADVSPTQYVQVVNGLIQVYNKTGARIGAPFTFGSNYAPEEFCAQADPATVSVAYDSIAGRWVFVGASVAISQVAICFVVTEGTDARGFFTTVTTYADGTDTPANLHLGVWTDGYYLAWDRYTGGSVFNGTFVAFQSRPGATLPQSVVVDLPPSGATQGIRGLVPADLDGVHPPPPGRPNTLASLVSTEAGQPADGLVLYDLLVFPGGSVFGYRPETTLSAPLAVPAYDPTSPAGLHDIRQPSPATDANALDAGSSALTGLHYRYDGAGTESLITSHTVGNPASATLGGYVAAPRFYHLRRTSGGGAYQLFDSATQTVANTTSRWAPAAALDRDLNVVMSYSASGDGQFPSLRMGMQEGPGTTLNTGQVVAGTGVQLSTTGAWPSATSVVIDPLDDCTFWMTGPYYTAASQAASNVGWLTRIATLRFSQCSAAAMGTLTGTVTAAGSGNTLAAVTLQFSDGSLTQTDATGVYSRTLPVGSYLVTIYKPGYLPIQATIEITAGAPVVANVPLTATAAPVIVPNGARLLIESLSPANLAVEPGETVTMGFALTNLGTTTSNLTATLTTAGGVLKPSAPQSYGAFGNRTRVERTFSFMVSPTVSCGEPAYAVLSLADGAANLGSVAFPLPMATERSLSLTQTFDTVTAPQLPTSAGWNAAITAGSAPGWVTSTASPFGGTTSAFVDAPGSVSDKELDSPSIPITTAGARLVFHHSYDFESGFDGGVLEVAVNGQAWTDIVAAGGTFLEGGYTGTLSSAYENPLAGRAAWTGSSAGYRSVVVQLPDAWVGKYVGFRFRSGTDLSLSGSGWFVDTVQVLETTCSNDAGQFMTNGGFTQGVDGFSGWNKFSLPDISYMPWGVNNGVLEYSRSTGSTQGVVFQGTGVAVAARQPLEATFQMRNTTNTRKRFSVLMHDSDFSDLSVCTFWMEANVPLAAYTMRMAPTKVWTNASISFYAATVGNAGGGSYGLDNVSLRQMPFNSSTVTDCVDPTAPQTTGTAGGELLVNGAFETGLLTPWSTFGNINWTIAGNLFAFHKLAGNPAGVVLQNTNAPLANDDRFTVSMSLGNASAVRQRVTVLVHARDFSDLTACTFWLPPATPPATYALTGFATTAWPFASVSVYPATTAATPSTLQWLILDNVSLTKTTTATGTTCQEP